MKEFQLHAPQVLALLMGHVQKNQQNPLATRVMHSPSLLSKLSPHRRHLSDLSFQGRGQRGLKVNHLFGMVVYKDLPLTSGAKLYTDSVLLIFCTLIDVREFSHKESD